MKRLTITLCMTIVVLLGSAEMGWGADYQRGLIAYSNWDYVTAIREWEPLARQGHPRAQQKLGLLYFNGQGVLQNYETALMWWKLAAKQGNVAARNGIRLAEAKIMPLKGWTWGRKKNGWGWVKPRREKTRLPMSTLPSRFSYPKKVTPTVTARKSPSPSPSAAEIENERLRRENARLKKQNQSKPKNIARKPSTTVTAKKTEPKPVQKVPKRLDDIAVIIANSNYQKLGKGIPNVKPAYRDAKNIKKYFMESLGVREGNIIYLKDATKAQMTSVLGSNDDHRGKLFNWTKRNVSKVYVYYAGHGAPAGDKGTTYLVPADADSETVQLTGYPLKQLYRNLGKVPATSITVILEACFSGQSQSGYLSSKISGIRIVPRMPSTPKKITVISAGAANQVATWEEDESQSLFTKYFLKGMSGEGDKKPYGNENGKVSLRELKKYLDGNMTYYARRYYGRTQQAQIVVNGKELSPTN